jgi:hypothetical protein
MVKLNRRENGSMQQVKVGHWEQAVFPFKTFGEIRCAGKP